MFVRTQNCNGFELNELVLYKKDNKKYRIYDWRIEKYEDNIDGVVLDLDGQFSPYFIFASFEDIEKVK